MEHPPVDVRALRDLAVEVAQEAGRLLTDGLTRARTTVDTKSTSTDMVTEMDRASEALIVQRLTAARPDDGVIGEEGAARPSRSGVTWVVDPLDGTTNYLYGFPGWNVSIGAEVAGDPVAGAVVVPATGTTFAAAAGHGATADGAALRLRPPAPLAGSLVGTGFSYDPAVRVRQATAVAALIGRIRDVRRSGAAAADLCSVAAGRLDAYFESGLAPWDLCAGTVIAREAGARVEIVDDHPLPGVLAIAAHPRRWDDLAALLADAGVLGPPASAHDHDRGGTSP